MNTKPEVIAILQNMKLYTFATFCMAKNAYLEKRLNKKHFKNPKLLLVSLQSQCLKGSSKQKQIGIKLRVP